MTFLYQKLVVDGKSSLHDNSSAIYCVFEERDPNFISQVEEIETFCEDCKLAAPLGFFWGFELRFRILTRPAKNA